jgi:glycosyltransferase involved in cell wall biosynthesis
MRILHIYELGPLGEDMVHGGLEIAILELCRALAERGHEVSILAGAGENGSTRKFYLGDVEVIPVDFLGMMKRTWSASNLTMTRQVFFPFAVRNLRGFDIYHGHVYVSGFLAWYMARRNNAAAINTLHGSYYNVWDRIEPRGKALFFKAMERILVPLLGRIVDLQIHTSPSFAEQAKGWGVPKEKIRFIPNGVDQDTFRETPMVREVPGRIFTARRLVKKNGLEHLIRALRHLGSSKYRLYIAGDGPERKRLEGLSAALGLRDKVTFLGLVRHRDVASHLARAELAVLPSLVEATSLFMLEALAMGKVVIATRSEGLKEVINRYNGVLVEPGDEKALAEAILAADSKPGVGISKKAAAVKTARNYPWKRIAELTEEEYERVMKLRR